MSSSGSESSESTDSAPEVTGQARGGRPRDATIDARVLPVVRDMLVETGWNDFSVRAVAARTGVGRATISRRWGTKAELVLTAVLRDRLEFYDIATEKPEGWIDAVINQSRTLFSDPGLRAAIPGLLSTFESDPAVGEALWQSLAGSAASQYADAAEPADRENAANDALAMILIAAGTAFFASVLPGDVTPEPVQKRIDALLRMIGERVVDNKVFTADD